MNRPDISIVIPSYGRPAELSQLLESIHQQTLAPREVLICEDRSPKRSEISLVCESQRQALERDGISVIYIENDQNLGFDKNLRKCIESASSEWTLVMGDDDILLPVAVATVHERVLGAHQDFFTRAFVRFQTNIDTQVGRSAISNNDDIFQMRKSPARRIFQSARFISGLVIRSKFAREHSCSKFDGTLYYQIYLASEAFCANGIGYIATPIVGGRIDNPPLFGNSANERGIYVPGRYTAGARVNMWKGVIDIVDHVGSQWDVDLVSDIRHELTVRESFHVFEMNAGASRNELLSLREGLKSLGLFSHPIPWIFFALDYFLGKRARPLFRAARFIMQ